MQFNARALNIRFSPFKLRPIADVIRGKNAQYALSWLATLPLKRAVPIAKVVSSAMANAKYQKNVEADQLKIKEIRVDQGPAYRYFKPGAMGRANVYKKRFSHISVTVESIDSERG
jgi:large subunit ribosomal protein L22